MKENQRGSSLFILRTDCFVCVEGSRSHAQLTFTNNTAGKGGDVLYGGLVALGYDGDWNCLLSFKNISDMSEQSGLSLISSSTASSTSAISCISLYSSTLTISHIPPSQEIKFLPSKQSVPLLYSIWKYIELDHGRGGAKSRTGCPPSESSGAKALAQPTVTAIFNRFTR